MKKSLIWNTLGSGMFAANSVLLLLIVSRVFGVAAAGDFGIAFTTAQILYIIGLFGINHFQMTDYAEQYSFASYRAAKWITTAAMICGCLVLFFFGGNVKNSPEWVSMAGYHFLPTVGFGSSNTFCSQNILKAI